MSTHAMPFRQLWPKLTVFVQIVPSKVMLSEETILCSYRKPNHSMKTKKRAILLNFHLKINFFCVSGKFEGMRDFLSQKIQVKEKSYFLDSIIQKLPVWRHLTVALALRYKSWSACIWFLILHKIMKILTGHLLFLS